MKVATAQTQYAFANTARLALGLPLKMQVPGSSAPASGMQRQVTANFAFSSFGALRQHAVRPPLTHSAEDPRPMTTLRFLGAAGTVSGSRHLLEHDGRRVLFDCGLFQGEKRLRERNWQPFPEPAESVDAVVLTHGHIDHSGWLPRLVREGFRGRIHTSRATADLLGLLLYDSAKCQAEDAEYANRKYY